MQQKGQIVITFCRPLRTGKDMAAMSTAMSKTLYLLL